MSSIPKVSIIIPTFNSAATLERTLDSIGKQTYKNIEIIIIDKKSNDKTVDIGTKYHAIIMTVDAKERSEQLNFGVSHSISKYIYRVDSDFILDATVVETAVSECERNGFDAVLIHNTSDPTISYWSKVRQMERDCYRGDKLNVAARFMRRTVFEDLHGFDESMVASEDYDLHNRLLKGGYRIGVIEPEETHIGEPLTLAEIAKKHYYYGKTISLFIIKNKKRGIQQLSPFRPGLIRNWQVFIGHPRLTAGFFIYQITRYYAALMGFVVGAIHH